MNVFRHLKKRSCLCFIPIILAFALLTPSSALAQQDSANLSIQQFRPWGDPDGILQTQSGNTLGQWNFKVGLFLNYSKDAFILRDSQTSNRIGIINHQFGADFMLGLGLLSWLDVELSIPMTIYQSAKMPDSIVTSNLQGLDISGFAMSNMKIGLKIQALRQKKHWLNLGFQFHLGLPTGSDNMLNGGEGVSFGIRLFASKKISIVNLALNFGYRHSPAQKFVQLNVEHELTYSLGASIQLIPKSLDLLIDLAGSAAFQDVMSSSAAPLEVMAGLRLYPMNKVDLAVNFGAGIGLIEGFGTPQFRIFAGVIWARRVYDQDGDGITDDKDRCPKTPGPRENGGCPWGDYDKDGLTDNIDKCPKKYGPKENKGCPWGDYDKDGLTDNIDKCPKKYGPRENNGCPWPDRDKDGFHDKIDECPDKPGIKEFNGCPDTDRDGLHDKIDLCPNRAGPKKYQGCPDTDGDKFHDKEDLCPTKWGPRPPNPPSNWRKGCPVADVSVVRGRAVIKITQKIHFEFNKYRILSTSYYILDNVVRILKKHRNMRVRIEGHTDNVGTGRYNLWLSRRRAKSVRTYLINKGISRSRLSSRGYGMRKPIATNRTDDGRAQNRRVEFVILDKASQRSARNR